MVKVVDDKEVMAEDERCGGRGRGRAMVAISLRSMYVEVGVSIVFAHRSVSQPVSQSPWSGRQDGDGDVGDVEEEEAEVGHRFRQLADG